MGRDVPNECDVRDEANDLYNLSEDPRIEFKHYTLNNLHFTLGFHYLKNKMRICILNFLFT